MANADQKRPQLGNAGARTTLLNVNNGPIIHAGAIRSSGATLTFGEQQGRSGIGSSLPELSRNTNPGSQLLLAFAANSSESPNAVCWACRIHLCDCGAGRSHYRGSTKRWITKSRKKTAAIGSKIHAIRLQSRRRRSISSRSLFICGPSRSAPLQWPADSLRRPPVAPG